MFCLYIIEANLCSQDIRRFSHILKTFGRKSCLLQNQKDEAAVCMFLFFFDNSSVKFVLL